MSVLECAAESQLLETSNLTHQDSSSDVTGTCDHARQLLFAFMNEPESTELPTKLINITFGEEIDATMNDLSENLEISATTPEMVKAHLRSHIGLIESWYQAGLITQRTKDYLKVFALRHDNGYETDALNDLLQNKKRVEEELVLLGNSIDVSKETTGMLLDILEKQQNNYLVKTILGHGIMGYVRNVLFFEKNGLNIKDARGMAATFAAHHSGFPIGRLIADDFVKWQKMAADNNWPNDLRRLFLIDARDSNATYAAPKAPASERSEYETAVATAGDELREKLVHFANQQMENDDSASKNTAMLAVLGYMTDRSVSGREEEVYVKKYTLILGDIYAEGLEQSIEALLNRTLDECNKEMDNAKATAEYFQFPLEMRTKLSALMDQQRQSIHRRHALALNFAKKVTDFSGSFADINTDERLMKDLVAGMQTVHKNLPGTIAAEDMEGALTLLKVLQSVENLIAIRNDTKIEQMTPGRATGRLFHRLARELAKKNTGDSTANVAAIEAIADSIAENEKNGTPIAIEAITLKPGNILIGETEQSRTGTPDDGTCIFIVPSGTPLIYENGETIEITSGGVMGEIGAIGNERTATLRLANNTEPIIVYKIKKQDLDRMLAETAVSGAVFPLITQRLIEQFKRQK